MSKNNRITRRRDSSLKYIENHLRRKTDRQRRKRTHPLDVRTTPHRLDGYKSEPQTQVIATPLNTHNGIYQGGFYHQGDSHTNLGIINAPGRATGGPDEGSNYRVENNLEGIHKVGPSRTMLNDRGEISVWMRSFNVGEASEEDYEYVISVHELNSDATPVDEESFIIRWEYDGAATPSHVLRLYPDIGNYPTSYIELDVGEAAWQNMSWTELIATWSYQDQEWNLSWNGNHSSTLEGPDVVIPWPGWDEFTHMEVFSDLNGENVVYHDVAHLIFQPFQPATFAPPAGLVYYFDDEADVGGIGGYKRVRRALPVGAEANLTQTGKAADGEMLLGTFITTVGVPGSEILPAGLWNWHCYAYVDKALGSSYLKFYIYKRSAAGAETALFNCTSNSVENLAVELQHFIHTAAAYGLETTDRLVVKVYFYTTSAADIKMTFVYDDTDHASHVHLPITVGPSVTPGGSDGEVQFNDSGAFGGDAGFNYDKTNNQVGINCPVSATVTTKLKVDGDAEATGTMRVGEDIDLYGSNKELRFHEGLNHIGFEAPALTADQIWVLPDADGAAKDVITTDAGGNLTWDYNYSETYAFGTPEQIQAMGGTVLLSNGLNTLPVTHGGKITRIEAYVETWAVMPLVDQLTVTLTYGTLGATNTTTIISTAGATCTFGGDKNLAIAQGDILQVKCATSNDDIIQGMTVVITINCSY